MRGFDILRKICLKGKEGNIEEKTEHFELGIVTDLNTWSFLAYKNGTSFVNVAENFLVSEDFKLDYLSEYHQLTDEKDNEKLISNIKSSFRSLFYEFLSKIYTINF